MCASTCVWECARASGCLYKINIVHNARRMKSLQEESVDWHAEIYLECELTLREASDIAHQVCQRHDDMIDEHDDRPCNCPTGWQAATLIGVSASPPLTFLKDVTAERLTINSRELQSIFCTNDHQGSTPQHQHDERPQHRWWTSRKESTKVCLMLMKGSLSAACQTMKEPNP